MEISGKTALVTGGASGLGLATVRRLVSEGAHVVALDLPTADPGALEEIGSSVEFAPADVLDEAAVQSVVELANRRRNLSAVINCAGIGRPGRTAGSKGPLPLADFRRAVEVNLIGTFNSIRLAAQAIIDNAGESEERGVIVNTASVAAYDGQIGQAAYAASKAGIVGLTLPVARDLARYGIRVVTIAPGLFDTPLLGELPQDVRDSLGAQVPHPARLGQPEEYADLVSAVLRNPMLNGETIRPDGAIRLSPR